MTKQPQNQPSDNSPKDHAAILLERFTKVDTHTGYSGPAMGKEYVWFATSIAEGMGHS